MKASQRAAAVLLGLLVVLLLGSPAHADPVAISLDGRGPSPAAASGVAGQQVVFSNDDPSGVSHALSATSSNWTLKKTLAAGATATVTLTSSGTYTYSDTHVVAFFQRVDAGTITLSAAARPSASPSPSASPTRSTRPSATPSRTPEAGPTPTSSSGVALAPGIGILPSASAAPSAGPAPNLAPAVPGATADPTATPSPGTASYSARGLVQGSAHRYGLPAALAVVAIAGVLSLLVRLLLAHPAAAPPEATDAL